MILVGCKRCKRTYWYPERARADVTCPDCDNGPFDDWFREIATADELRTALN